MAQNEEDELLAYDESDEEGQKADADAKDNKKGHYVGIYASTFRDFILKPELLRAVVDCGFEHPSVRITIFDSWDFELCNYFFYG